MRHRSANLKNALSYLQIILRLQKKQNHMVWMFRLYGRLNMQTILQRSVVGHVMKWITENEGDEYDLCLMESSSSFLSYRDIDSAYEIEERRRKY